MRFKRLFRGCLEKTNTAAKTIVLETLAAFFMIDSTPPIFSELFFKLFKKTISAPTYETATTRKYREGRTETLRSGSNQALAFVSGMDNPQTDISTKRKLLRTALVRLLCISKYFFSAVFNLFQ